MASSVGGFGGYGSMAAYKAAKAQQAASGQDGSKTFGNRTPGAPAPRYGDGQMNTSVGDYLGVSMKGEPGTYQADIAGFQYGGAPGRGDAAVDRYQGMGAGMQGRSAYQMDPSQQNQARGYQNFAAGDYIRTLNGQNPSAARMMMERGLGQAQGNALGMAAGARGGGANSAAAMRAALATNNQMASQTNQAAGIEAAREREAARAGLASVGGQMRGQDIGWQQGQGSLEMQQRGLNDASQLGYERLGADVRSQELQAAQNYERTRQEAELAQRNQNFNVQKYNKDQSMSGIGAIGTAIASMFSDERLKKDVSDGSHAAADMSSNPYNKGSQASADMATNPYRQQAGEEDAAKRSEGRRLFQEAFERRAPSAGGDASAEANKSMVQGAGALGGMFSNIGGGGGGGSSMGAAAGKMLSDERAKSGVGEASGLQDFARKMNPKSFRYKSEPESAPKRVGVMAQDVERSELGSEAVVETPDGKMIDIPKGLSLALAAIAEMRDELDGKKRKKG